MMFDKYTLYQPDGGPLSIYRDADKASFNLSMENRDCKIFVQDWEAGAVLTDVAGAAIPYSAQTLANMGLFPVPQDIPL